MTNKTRTALDTFVDTMQADADRLARDHLGAAGFALWQHPARARRPDGTNRMGQVRGSHGENLVLYLRMQNGLVEDAGFETDGCGSTLACLAMCCELCVGKTLEQLRGLTAKNILRGLGGLSETSAHCADAAIGALGAALSREND